MKTTAIWTTLLSTLVAPGLPLGALASAFSLVRDNGGQLKLVVRCATVRELSIRTKLLDLLPTFPTEAEAIASFDHASSVTASA